LKTLVKKALGDGVSFAIRGNLIILAPPLVIEELKLTDALALLNRLLSEMESI
jgi:taurine---2-oxoglutarate transaminase